MLWLWFPLLALSWSATALACFRLCRAAAAARPAPENALRGRAPNLYEAAFLSGGPRRVADLALVSMARDGRLLLAHTGWATVAVPDGEDSVERAVITAAGPEGQARTTLVRTLTAASAPVGALADRLAAEGLALPGRGRSGVASAVRAVRRSVLLALGLGLAAGLLVRPPEESLLITGWFALPFGAGLMALAAARFELHPYSHWATPAGERLLETVSVRDDLAAIALGGIHAIRDPALRTALGVPSKGH